MINNLEDFSKEVLIETIKIHVEEYKKLEAENKLLKERFEFVEKDRDFYFEVACNSQDPKWLLKELMERKQEMKSTALSEFLKSQGIEPTGDRKKDLALAKKIVPRFKRKNKK